MTLCVASQRVFIVVVVYFVIDSVRKLLDTPCKSQLGLLQNKVISNKGNENLNDEHYRRCGSLGCYEAIRCL
jgi:hypothetical protein